jgi:acetyltransferase-like isoleucine patch superfamily enzyme
MSRKHSSHGTGEFTLDQFEQVGKGVVIELGVLVFHPENIQLGENVYVGHQTIIKGYYKNKLKIGDNCWIGQQVFIHSAGGVEIHKNVGIGPGVKILTSTHSEEGCDKPIIERSVQFSPVIIEEDCDIGVNSVILPGVTLGRGTQVGAGAVVTKSFLPYSVVGGVPAKLMRSRAE